MNILKKLNIIPKNDIKDARTAYVESSPYYKEDLSYPELLKNILDEVILGINDAIKPNASGEKRYTLVKHWKDDRVPIVLGEVKEYLEKFGYHIDILDDPKYYSKECLLIVSWQMSELKGLKPEKEKEETEKEDQSK